MNWPRNWNIGTIDPTQVRAFADASRDHNEIHLSAEAAAKAGLEQGPIVHGMLIYGAVETRLTELDGFVLRRLTLQFVKPLLVGAELHIEARPLREDADEILLRVVCRNGDREINAIAEAALDKL